MTYRDLLKILTISFILLIVSYSQALAHSWEEKTCNDASRFRCYNCGNKCTATLYQDGRLVVSGTGMVNGGGGWNTTFSELSVKPTSLIIEEGITGVGTNAFWNVSTVTSLELPNSFQTISPDGLDFNDYSNPVEKFIIGENSNLITDIPMASNVTVVCKGDVEVCRKSKSSIFTSKNVTATFTDELRDENGNLLQKWSANGSETYDANGNILAKYSKSGDLLAQYVYESDGSTTIYDGKGNIIGFKGKRIYTVDEATKVASPKGNTFSIKYR